jgi:hypothetical protein
MTEASEMPKDDFGGVDGRSTPPAQRQGAGRPGGEAGARPCRLWVWFDSSGRWVPASEVGARRAEAVGRPVKECSRRPRPLR